MRDAGSPRLAAFAAIVLWGISFVATRVALVEISPVTLVFTRFALGTALLFLILAARGRLTAPPRPVWPMVVLLGFLGIFVHQMVQAHALRLTTAVNTGWLIGLTPIWSAILAAAVLKEKLGARKIVGLLIGFAGAALVVTRGDLSSATFALPTTKGDLLILASTFNWAIYTALGRGTLARVGAARATAFAMLVGWLMLAVVFVAQAGWSEWSHLTARGWASVLFLGIGCSGLGYLFWYAALERLDTTRVAAFLYLEPLVTLAAAVAFLGEPVYATTIVGGLIVLAGVFIVQSRGVSPLPAGGEKVRVRDAA